MFVVGIAHILQIRFSFLYFYSLKYIRKTECQKRDICNLIWANQDNTDCVKVRSLIANNETLLYLEKQIYILTIQQYKNDYLARKPVLYPWISV